MSCCNQTYGVPGTPTLSSGLTAAAAEAARRADQARVLASLQRGSACCPTTPSNKSAVFASIVTIDKTVACQANQVTQAFQFPRAGITENARIQRKIDATLNCAYDPNDPRNRYVMYRQFVPQAPCPPPTAAQLNSTQPKPSFTVCQPPRF
jgi:hypothetical protein